MNDFFSKIDLNITDVQGKTPLHHMCINKVIDEVKIKSLIENKSNLWLRDNKDKTAFHYLLLNESTNQNLIKFFLEKNADINFSDDNGKNLLHFLIEEHKKIDLDLLAFLINHLNLDLNSREKNFHRTPLLYEMCKENYSFKTIKFLLENNSNPNLKDYEGLIIFYNKIK